MMTRSSSRFANGLAKRSLVLVSLLVVCLFTSHAHALTIADVTFEDSRALDGKTLHLNGVAVRKKLIFQVYAAGLYVEEKSNDAQKFLETEATRHLRMVFLRDVDASRIKSAWDEGFESNCAEFCESLRPKMKTLNSWMVDLKKGDVLAFTFRKGSVEVLKGDQSLGTVEGDGIDKSILSIFIGKTPATADLRSGLLGGSSAK